MKGKWSIGNYPTSYYILSEMRGLKETESLDFNHVARLV